MRRNYIGNIIVLALLTLAIYSCREAAGDTAHASHEHGQEYTCPMHPEIIKNAPGKCPVCGMDLVLKSANKELVVDSVMAGLAKPVNAQVMAGIPAIVPQTGTRIFSIALSGMVTYDARKKTSISSRVTGRIERLLIKYNYQPIEKGQLIMEIYSPDLAAAQRELLFVSGTNDPAMLAKAKQRLELLGMQPSQIQQVIHTQQIMYRFPVYSNSSGYILEQLATQSQQIPSASMPVNSAPSPDGMGSMGGQPSPPVTNSTPSVTTQSPVLLREGQYVNAGQALFTIYQAGNLLAEFAIEPQLAAQIKKGQKLLYYPVADKNNLSVGTIDLIEPVFQNGQSFTRARSYLKNANVQPGQLITGNIAIVLHQGYWIPKKSLLRLGAQTIVFKKENGAYVPRKVATAIEQQDLVQVTSDIGDWQIASNAYYLVDSESFIKTNNPATK